MDDNKKSNNVIDLNTNRGDEIPHSPHGNYKPDDELLQSTARIKKQRDAIQERIDKMESAQEKVSKSVYEKVKRDYSLQLQTISELLDEKKALLKSEVKDLYMRREKLSVEISRHKEILEEAEFRHFLNEFTQSQYQEVENFETKEIEKLETDLATIGEFIRSHEELFDPQDLGLPAKKKQEPEVTKTVAPEPKPAEEVIEPQEEHTPAKARLDSPDEEVQQVAEAPVVETAEEEGASEFEDLFLDEEEGEADKIKEQESITNIKKIIEENAEEIDDNYFEQEKVNESSFTVKKKDFDTDTVVKDDVAQEEEQSAGDQIQTDVSITKNEVEKDAPVENNDSISEILDSIKLEESQSIGKQGSEEEIPLELDADSDTGYFLTLIEGEHETKEYSLKDNISIGRSPTNEVVLKAPKVSRQHAAINMYNNQFIIIDLKSSNGVYVNGQKIDECVLSPGDEVSVGGYKFIFQKR